MNKKRFSNLVETIIPFLLVLAGLVVSASFYFIVNPLTFDGEVVLIIVYIVAFIVLFKFLSRRLSIYEFGNMYKSIFLFIYVIVSIVMLFKVHFTVMYI